MSDTEQLFVLAGVWVAIAAVIARFIPGWPARIVVFALLVGIPFWELPFGYYNFQKLCSEQAKLKIFDKIPPQDSVCIDYPDVQFIRVLLKQGFTVVEVPDRFGDIEKRLPDFSPGKVKSGQFTSPYCVVFASNTPLPWRVLRHDVQIVRARNGHVVARQSQFGWSGMWWQQSASPVLGRGGDCYEDPTAPVVALRNGAG